MGTIEGENKQAYSPSSICPIPIFSAIVQFLAGCSTAMQIHPFATLAALRETTAFDTGSNSEAL